MERSRLYIVFVLAFVSANLWKRSFTVITSLTMEKWNVGLTDYLLPPMVDVKAEQPYTPLPPVDPEIARSLTTHAIYSRLVNVDQELPVREHTQIPYFWHIHKSGGSSMKEVLRCFNRTITNKRCAAGNLSICNPDGNEARYVNVDTSSLAGIDRAAQLRLLDAHVEKLVVDTSRVYEALHIFPPPYQARLFLLLRDPVDRAISKFYYLKIAKWEPTYTEEMANMTLMQYAHSSFCYNDWVTRRLVHKMTGHLTNDDFVTAKEVLRQKALILFTKDMDGAIQRLLRYFGWPATDKQRTCAYQFSHKPANQNAHPIPSQDSEEWKAIAQINQFDVLLYEYAKQLYAQQSLLLKQMPIQ